MTGGARRLWWIVAASAAATALTACFSADDFDQCRTDADCAGDRCVAGHCEAGPRTDATLPVTDGGADAEVAPADAALDDDCVGVSFTEASVFGAFNCPDRTVVIDGLDTADPQGLNLRTFELRARRIEIRGPLSAKGAGYRGGGGGGGGGGARTDGQTAAGGPAGLVGNGAAHTGQGTAGLDGADGGATPGRGGRGGAGGGGRGGGSGDPGAAGSDPGAGGSPGRDGFHQAVDTPRASWPAELCDGGARPGAGGGGGGGGAGALDAACIVGPGAGGGGAGTPGGGAVVLYASEEILIDAVLDASGGDRRPDPDSGQFPAGPCGREAACLSTCEALAAPGRGGGGGSSSNAGQPGALGAETAMGARGGRGGDGGLGSGGFVRLQAPLITWGEHAQVNLSGGNGSADNPGLLVIFGQEAGPAARPVTPETAFVCDPRPFVPFDAGSP